LDFTSIHTDVNSVSLLTNTRGFTSSNVVISHVSTLNDSALKKNIMAFLLALLPNWSLN